MRVCIGVRQLVCVHFECFHMWAPVELYIYIYTEKIKRKATS